MRKIILIAAMGRHREIGLKQGLLWNLPRDMRFFRETTRGKTVLMGRKTFESIGRPLPNRRNMVLTRGIFFASGVEIFSDLEKALFFSETKGDIFIIGGSQIYALALKKATHLFITRVMASFPKADSFFPNFLHQEWKKTFSQSFSRDEENAYDMVFEKWKRIS